MNRVRGLFGALKTAVIAVRVSGGHLCEAEAPTEPAGETAVRRAAIRFPFKGITFQCIFNYTMFSNNDIYSEFSVSKASNTTITFAIEYSSAIICG